MGKKEKIIITVLLAIILLLIIAYLLYQNVYLSSLPSETGIIVKKDDNEVMIKYSEDTTTISCKLDVEKNKPVIKNIDGKRINYSDLNIGDKIKINYIDRKDKVDYTPEIINNIKLIKVVEDNSDNHMTEEELNYNYFFTKLLNPTEGKLTLSVKQTNTDYPIDNFFSSDITVKILKKDDDNTEKIIERFEFSDITYDKNIESEYTIILDKVIYDELQKELEIGKYILKIENENGDFIKIPFEKNEENFLQWN